jgi:hypothetical protein
MFILVLLLLVTPARAQAVEVPGGCFLPTKQCIDTAKELERLRAENKSLRDSAGDFSASTVVVVVAVALVTGAGGVLLLKR